MEISRQQLRSGYVKRVKAEHFHLENLSQVITLRNPPEVITKRTSTLRDTEGGGPLNLEGRVEFIGREAFIDKLHQKLHCNQNEEDFERRTSNLSQTVVIYGMTGVGKRAVARKYIQDFKPELDFILWIDSINHYTIRKDLQAFAEAQLNQFYRDTKVPQMDPDLMHGIFDVVLRKRTLIVFANAKSLNQHNGIERFLPRTLQRGWREPSIIITSNLQNWNSIQMLPLRGFSDEESGNFILRHLKIKETPEIIEMAVQLGRIYAGLPSVLILVLSQIQEEYAELLSAGEGEVALRRFLNSPERALQLLYM